MFAHTIVVVSGYAFISYSRDDRAYVEKLAAHLTAMGIPIWYDYRLVAGEIFDEEIERRIGDCAAFLVVLSPRSVDSQWVGREITYADDLHKQLIPLLLEPVDHSPIRLAGVQREDVVGGTLPGVGFIEHIRTLTTADAPVASPGGLPARISAGATTTPSLPQTPDPEFAAARPASTATHEARGARPLPTGTFVRRPSRRWRGTRAAIWRNLWTLAAGESWLSARRRASVAATRFAFLGIVIVGIVTFVRHVDFPATDSLWWLSSVGAAGVACAGAAYKKEWMFSTSVALVVAGRWAVVGTSVPEDVANLIMALVLGILLVIDRARHRPRASVFRTLALVAGTAVAFSCVYQTSNQGYEWWPTLLDRLRWFLPLIAAQVQLSWESDLGARRVSGAMAATFGSLFAIWAVLSLRGADSVVAGTTADRVLDLACGLVLLTGGSVALRYRRHLYY
jgi:hypothetical protein